MLCQNATTLCLLVAPWQWFCKILYSILCQFFFKKFSELLNLFDMFYYFSYQYFTTNILDLLSKIYSCNMKRIADIDIDQAIAQMNLASSGSSSESSLADSSDLSSPSEDDNEGSSSLEH